MADDSGTIVASTGTLNIPSGSGSERLRRVTVNAQNNGWQNNVISGTAGHLYTILSIIFCDTQGASGVVGIKINDGSNDINILANQAHAAWGTFVFNDKFVIEEDDDLDVYNSVTAGDWIVSYIDQDWT
tara:strand:- start:96 stop:482 length:387 start_codon:yes stop_codon:yes gene_type:complete